MHLRHRESLRPQLTFRQKSAGATVQPTCSNLPRSLELLSPVPKLFVIRGELCGAELQPG